MASTLPTPTTPAGMPPASPLTSPIPILFHRAPDAPTRLEFPTGSMVVVGGPVGVGKSTLIRRLSPPGAEIIGVDMIREDVQAEHGLPREIYVRQMWEEAILRFEQRLSELLAAGRNVLVDMTAVYPFPRATLASIALQNQRPAHLIMLDGDLKTCLRGQRGRPSPIRAIEVLSYVRAWEELREHLKAGNMETIAGYDSVQVLQREAADQLSELSFSL